MTTQLVARLQDWLTHLAPLAALGWFLLQNLVIAALAVLAGALVQRLWRHRQVSQFPAPLTGTEVALTASTIALNAVVTWVGWKLWLAGLIRFEQRSLGESALDCLVLLALMDAAMYVLHRVAHHPLLYPLLHAPHHRYRAVRPLTLFVLHPAEVLGFGGLWLVVLMIWPASWLGMAAYLVLNVAFGTVGHTGVEPLPAVFARTPGLKLLSGGAFHADHHRDERGNFGFYTAIWDRLLRTGVPER